MEDMEGEGRSKKRKRYKVQCGLCKKTFDNDYRSNHNKKYSDYVKGKRPILFHTAVALLNPFTVASKKRAQTSENPATTEVILLFCTILIQMLLKILRQILLDKDYF